MHARAISSWLSASLAGHKSRRISSQLGKLGLLVVQVRCKTQPWWPAPFRWRGLQRGQSACQRQDGRALTRRCPRTFNLWWKGSGTTELCKNSTLKTHILCASAVRDAPFGRTPAWRCDAGKQQRGQRLPSRAINKDVIEAVWDSLRPSVHVSDVERFRRAKSTHRLCALSDEPIQLAADAQQFTTHFLLLRHQFSLACLQLLQAGHDLLPIWL
mmetsp:Transcript_5370/g.12633  ORF Transcript_5370/g.12633 Transcript_5370/m.12633 type:complete len:214 (+) Transcript_5370:131-772(+)